MASVSGALIKSNNSFCGMVASRALFEGFLKRYRKPRLKNWWKWLLTGSDYIMLGQDAVNVRQKHMGRWINVCSFAICCDHRIGNHVGSLLNRAQVLIKQ